MEIFACSLLNFCRVFIFVIRAHRRNLNVPKINSGDNCRAYGYVIYGAKQSCTLFGKCEKMWSFQEEDIISTVNSGKRLLGRGVGVSVRPGKCKRHLQYR